MQKDSYDQKAFLCVGICGFMTIFLVYTVSISRSLIITGLTWLSVFSFFAIISTVIAFTCKSDNNKTNEKKYTYGKVRVPVLAVFSTTVLAQLSAVFLAKEAIERLFHHGHGQSHHAHHDEGTGEANSHDGEDMLLDYYFYLAAFASSTSLLTVAYGVVQQPFNYVLKHASSSMIQEHVSDISHALCYFIPGLARILLPRINSLTVAFFSFLKNPSIQLLAVISSLCVVFVQLFKEEFSWIDSVAALILSFVVFSSMMPLSTFTGRILLQTTPPHVQNQIDRLVSEASTVDGVLELINVHFWQLDFNTIVGTVDVRVRRDTDEQIVLRTVYNKLSTLINICTVQMVKDPTSIWTQHNQQRYAPISATSQHKHTKKSPSPEQFNYHSDEHGHAHSHSSHSHNHHHH